MKGDKGDLLAHVKQLCASLQDKEQELRDFIRNFEQRMRETETSVSKVSSERERERWSLLKHAREEAERSIALAAQLNTRDMQLKRVQEQLQEVIVKLFLENSLNIKSIAKCFRLADNFPAVCQIKRAFCHLHH